MSCGIFAEFKTKEIVERLYSCFVDGYCTLVARVRVNQ